MGLGTNSDEALGNGFVLVVKMVDMFWLRRVLVRFLWGSCSCNWEMVYHHKKSHCLMASSYIGRWDGPSTLFWGGMGILMLRPANQTIMDQWK